MMALRLVLLPPFLLLAYAMVAECANVLPYLKLPETALSELWEENKEGWFHYTLETPLEVEDMPPLQKVVIEVFSSTKGKGRKRFHEKEELWAKIIGGVDSRYPIQPQEERSSRRVVDRKTVEMEDVMPLLKKAVYNHASPFLPAFAVTSFTSGTEGAVTPAVVTTPATVGPATGGTAATAGAGDTGKEKLCIVRPFFEGLSKQKGVHSSFESNDTVLNWLYGNLRVAAAGADEADAAAGDSRKPHAADVHSKKHIMYDFVLGRKKP
eukprot:GHVS01055388.1.p1 GENE.GHVS01055388.1~~GHVS01055388.1.p1  ORF type:complete len:267 (-),score=56.44 GHVS01055388.1:177-977(-)